VPRPSPQTERVVTVIEYLSDRPDGASSTQIAQDTGINASTCVHVLATLTSAGFLYREPSDRRYHLGPALVRPGRVAAERYEFQAIARAEMQALSSIHNRPCFAFAPDGDHARLEQYTWPGPARPAVRVGDAIPLTPPLGAIFAAWADDDAVERWLSLDPDLTAQGRRRLRAQLAEIRSIGHVIETGGNRAGDVAVSDPDLPRVTDERPSPWRDRILHQMLVGQGPAEHVLTDIDPSGAYPVNAVGAPVFDLAGRIAMSLTLVFFDDAGAAAVVTGADLITMSADVREAAGRATAAIRASGTQG